MDQPDATLEQAVGSNIEDVRTGTNEYILHQHKFFFGFVALMCLCVSAACAYGLYELYVLNPSQFSAQLIIIPILPLLCITALYRYYYMRVEHLFVEEVATSLGYAYSEDAPLESVTAPTLKVGHSQKLFDVISGTYHGCPVRMFTYRYTVGSGKNSHTYTKAVFELGYSAALPHLVLKPVTWLGDITLFSSMSEVQLEGDFGKHFTLFADKDAQIQAREIFEPDVMQQLIDNFAGYSCELYGSKVYLVRTGPIYKREDFLALHALSDAFTDKVLPGLRSAAEDVVPAAAKV